jgi:DNA repair ATPase RecN
MEIYMAQKFKEVAHLRTDLDKYGEGYDRIFGNKEKTTLQKIEEENPKEGELKKLQAENAKLKDQDKILSQEIKTYIQIAENLRTVVKINQAENVKLRDALDKIDRSNDDMKYFNSDIHVIIHEVRDELKELENE